MRPKFDKETRTLTVEFHKPDIELLGRARDLGLALEAMNQSSGRPLVEAIDAVLFGTDVKSDT